MIFQFKKFFVSMVFTVALFCSLSVSASAVQYNLSDMHGSYMSHYDGSIAQYTDFIVGQFPLSLTTEYPSSVNTNFPKQVINFSLPDSFSAGNTLYFRFVFPAIQSSFNVSGVYSLSFLSSQSSGSMATLEINISDQRLNFANALSPMFESESLFSEFIYSEDGSLVGVNASGVLASDISRLQSNCYLGNTSYPYTVDTTFSSYDDFIVSDSPIVVAPVYNPQISASQFSVTSTTFTSEVFLVDLDPSKTYRPYWSLYKQSDLTTPIAQGYSNQIGDVTGVEYYTGYSRVVDLKPDTAYLINWNLYEVGSFPIPTASEVRFTTLSDGSSGGGSGTTDDSGGILLLILNKVSAILDAMNSGQSEGILSSVDEKLEALIDTLANPEEQELEDNFKGSLTEVNNNFFGDTAKGQAVTSSDVGSLADTQDTVKNIFQSDYTVTDFFGLFSDNSFFGWFSAETAMDLNPISYGGASVVDMDDPYNMQAYYENLEKVRRKK